MAAFRATNRAAFPDWFNAPVPSFGVADARLFVVGLAPGLRGANRTGRPFTGDYAGELLYDTLLQFGFASGVYDRRPDDGLKLVDCAIINAVRCVPPQNKPTPEEIRNCRTFLAPSLAAASRLKIVLALGRIAHESVLRAFGERVSSFKFAHGARHRAGARPGGLRQLPLLALQHEYRGANRRDVPRCVRGDPGGARCGLTGAQYGGTE